MTPNTSKPSGMKIAAWALLGMCVVYFGPAMAGLTYFTVLFFIQLAVGLLLLFIDSRNQKKSVPSSTPEPKPEPAKPPPVVPEPLPPHPLPPQPPPPPPIKNLLHGRYQIINENWKKGGMAIIHLAKDYQSNSQCIIKEPRLDTEHSPKLNVEKLKIEAEFLQKSSHPNIVRFIDQFTGLEGLFHLVEEYIEGSDLLTLFNRTVAEEHKVIKWAVQILDALHYIHRSGMVHRDLNPKNIMLSRDDNAVLIDFGTIKKSGDSDTKFFTTEGFTHPEVAQGFIDERSDIYGVGSILLYMLTSQRIGHLGGRNIVDFLSSQGVSPRTAKCIAQALQIDPVFRFQTAAVMRSAILGG